MCVHAYYSLNILFRYKILKECTVWTNNNDVNILFSNDYVCVWEVMPVTVAERSKACTVFARSEAGIVGSNSTEGMDV
jgi:hypothetical protein